MKTILSIQSHVAAGYVGNRAAVFPLQLMGYDVITINTVQFSNHTGYGTWTGQIFSQDHIDDLIRGLEARGLLGQIDGVLSGYMGDAALGQAVLDTVKRIQTLNPSAIYCCDPVMGDVGRGFFVKDSLPPFFRDKAAFAANILTPNLFELNTITNRNITTRAEALDACRTLHANGPAYILVTSLQTNETKPGQIDMLLSSARDGAWIVSTPKLDITPAPNGAGDLTSALFLGHILRGEKSAKALALTASNVFEVFEETKKAGSRELALIQAQDRIRKSKQKFKAIKL